jgi:hypothetical protein
MVRSEKWEIADRSMGVEDIPIGEPQIIVSLIEQISLEWK